jgi:hypothetical protein
MQKALITMTLLSTSILANASTLFYSARFDSAVINEEHSLTEGQVTFPFAQNGSWNNPVLFAAGSYSGLSLNNSVPATTTSPAPDGKTTDRSEYHWVESSDVNSPQFNQDEKYFGFNFKIVSAGSQPPVNGGVICVQFWQGSPLAPPVWMDVKAPNAQGQWPNRIWMQNDQTGQMTGDPSIKVYGGTIVADTWYRYVIGVEPGYNNNGRIDCWINGQLVASYTGNVGYLPQSLGGVTGALNGMMVKGGVYRSRINPPFSDAFDNIAFSDSYNLSK